jgi:hypothetical protein
MRLMIGGRHGLLPFFLMVFLLIAGCSPSKPSANDSEAVTARSCPEPQNPYTEGTGHYAGYEWAESNGSTSCDGSSDSFNEGCEEQQAQESEYEECKAKKKN